MSYRLRYAEDASKKLEVRKIYEWERGFMQSAAMSNSSGPKDQIRNQVFAIFEQRPLCDRVCLVRASGPAFVILRIAGDWFDVTGKQVLINA